MSHVTLYGSLESSCTRRVRSGLRLKRIDFHFVPLSLSRGDQRSRDFERLYPGKRLPVLVLDELVVAESVAQLELIEEAFPDRGHALLPDSARDRARVREIVQFVASTLHPQTFPSSTRAAMRIAGYRVGMGSRADALATHLVHASLRRNLDALEVLVGRYGGNFSVGHRLSMADCVVMPALADARVGSVSLNEWPRLAALYETCATMPEFELEPVRSVRSGRCQHTPVNLGVITAEQLNRVAAG
jgi:maleylacetoacetate isomerase